MAQLTCPMETQSNNGDERLSEEVLNCMVPITKNLTDVIKYSRHVHFILLPINRHSVLPCECLPC